MKLAKTYSDILGVIKKLPTNPHFATLINGDNRYAPYAEAQALEILLVIMRFRPVLLLDAADFREGSIYSDLGEDYLPNVGEMILRVLPKYMKAAHTRWGVFLYDSRSVTERKLQSLRTEKELGEILRYACPGEVNSNMVEFHILNNKNQILPIMTQSCRNITKGMNTLLKQLTKLSSLLNSLNPQFHSPSISIAK